MAGRVAQSPSLTGSVDLRAEAGRLTLDLLTVRACDALRAAGIPHVVIKGVSTSVWLYDPPRRYRDLDLLVPVSAVDDVVEVLARAGLARRGAGGVGEESPHSLMLQAPSGHEIDLHVSLPTVPLERDDRLWHVLAPHVTELRLDVGTVPALDEAARCLVIALHALNNGRGSGQPEDDLVLARRAASVEAWGDARLLAGELDAGDLFDAGVGLVEGRPEPSSVRARLFLENAPNEAFGLARLMRARRRELPLLVWQELIPSVGFMRRELEVKQGVPATGMSILREYPKRWWRLLRHLPGAIHALVRTRRRA